MKEGDIVKLKRAITIDNDAGEQMYISTKERFVVIDEFKHNVAIKNIDRFNHRGELLLGRCFLEVDNDTKESNPRRSSGEVNFNPAPELNKQDILALIDLALDTGDKEWFNELHSKLSALA